MPLIYAKWFGETCNAVETQKLGRTRMQAACSHVTATYTTLASTNCNHGFSISQPQGDRDFANCLARALIVRISSRLRLQRFGDKVSALRVGVSESENRTRLWSLDKIRFSLFFFGFLPRRKFSPGLDEALVK